MNLIAETLAFPALYSVDPDAIAARDKMLLAADAVLKPIMSAAENDAVARMGGDLQTHKKEVEEAGLSIRRLLNAETAKLMQIERNYLAPLVTKLKALGVEATKWDEAEKQRVAREEAARQAEFQRLEKERLEALQRAERARKEDNQLKHELTAHNAEQAQEALVTAALPTVNKARGAATKQKLRYEVTDTTALYKARPELCRIEENASAINAICFAKPESTAFDPDTSIPGLKLWNEDITSFRRNR